MGRLHIKRRNHMKEMYKKYKDLVSDPMSESAWMQMAINRATLTLSEAQRNYDPQKVKKETKSVKSEEDKKSSEKGEKETQEEKDDSTEKKEEKQKQGDSDKVSEESKKKSSTEEVQEKNLEDLQKAYEDEDYNALGKALKNRVEKTPSSKDDRLAKAKEILDSNKE